MNSKKMLDIIDNYLDYVIEIGDNPSEEQLRIVKDKYTIMKGEITKLCYNQRIMTVESSVTPKHYNEKNKKHCPVCNGWGCWNCCSSEKEIRSCQGTFG